ncbi:MAG: serine hydrolase [Chlamydiia bacterium]|nr:serine hydrolase [Chlamydiia bacterium]
MRTYHADHAVQGMTAIFIGTEDHQKFEKIVTLGTLSLKSPIPINEYSEFRIGPLTQLTTCAILAYFIKEGRVSLEDPVSKFLPKSMVLPTFEGRQMTLVDLATHTSGLPDIPYSLSSRRTYSISQMYRFLSKYELTHPPGSQYQYSNFGIAFLANLMSRVAKKAFPDLIQQTLLFPLGMKETTFVPRQDQKKRLVVGYEDGKGISPLLSEKIYSIFIGAGGLYSTPKDLLTFLSFNLKKERTSLNGILPLMQTPYHTFRDFQMGLGWKVGRLGVIDEPYYHLGGTLFGFGIYIGMVPNRDIGVIIITSDGDRDPTPFGEELVQLMAH